MSPNVSKYNINKLELMLIQVKMARTNKPVRKQRRTKKFKRGAPVGMRSTGLRRYTNLNVPRLGGPDKKYKDYNFQQGPIATAGNIFLLNGAIAQGDSDTTRTGNHLTMTNISIHGEVWMVATTAINVSDTAFNDDVRVMIVYDKQANGTALTSIGDLLTTANINSFRNMDTLERFIVLKDKKVKIGCTGSFTSGVQAMRFSTGRTLFKFNKKVALPVDYGGATTTGAIAEIKTGALYCIVISENANASCDLWSRVKYLDVYPYN